MPDRKEVNGGVLSIFSQAKEARRFKHIHNSEVIICTYPGRNSYGKNDLFKNAEVIYSFDEVVMKWGQLKNLLIHIPECGVKNAATVLNNNYYKYLSTIENIHINIMMQNIELAPSVADFVELFRITPEITQTTAHDRYTTQDLSNTYQTPVHHLSTFVDVSQYELSLFKTKKNLIVYSPDNNPAKKRVLGQLKLLGNFKMVEIKDLAYDDYKRLTSSAKFCITFGEGFDGYFLESYFSGSIGLAVYNSTFFPSKEFLEKLPGVFNSYDSMYENIVKVINSLESNEELYNSISKRGRKMMGSLYKYEKYVENIQRFYKKEYDIYPNDDRFKNFLITHLRSEKTQRERDSVSKLMRAEKELAELREVNKKMKRDLTSIIESRSWKLTKPLRLANKKRP